MRAGTTTYTVVVTNAGPCGGEGRDGDGPGGGGADKTGVTCAAAGGAVVPGEPDGGAIESGLAIPTLPSGGSVTFSIRRR